MTPDKQSTTTSTASSERGKPQNNCNTINQSINHALMSCILNEKIKEGYEWWRRCCFDLNNNCSKVDFCLVSATKTEWRSTVCLFLLMRCQRYGRDSRTRTVKQTTSKQTHSQINHNHNAHIEREKETQRKAIRKCQESTNIHVTLNSEERSSARKERKKMAARENVVLVPRNLWRRRKKKKRRK